MEIFHWHSKPSFNRYDSADETKSCTRSIRDLSLQVNGDRSAVAAAARHQLGVSVALSSIGLTDLTDRRRWFGVAQSLKLSQASADVISGADEKASWLDRPRSDNGGMGKSARKLRRLHRRRREDVVLMHPVDRVPITHDSDRDSVSSLPSTLAAYIREELEL
jgi:hypothetical protein